MLAVSQPKTFHVAKRCQLAENEALLICVKHIIIPESESVGVWGPLGRCSKIDEAFVKRTTGATKARTSHEDWDERGLLGSLFPRKTYQLFLESPQTIPDRLIVGYGYETKARTFLVYNSGNIAYAGIWLDDKHAIVNKCFFAKLESLGFTCSEASSNPHAPIFDGPLRNTYMVGDFNALQTVAQTK